MEELGSHLSEGAASGYCPAGELVLNPGSVSCWLGAHRMTPPFLWASISLTVVLEVSAEGAGIGPEFTDFLEKGGTSQVCGSLSQSPGFKCSRL